MSDPDAARPARGRMVILSTNPGGGTGAYMMLSYFLEAAVDHEPRPLLVLPASSEVYRQAVDLGYPVLDLGVRGDRLAVNLPAIARLAPRLRGARGVVAWHTRGFELALYLKRRLGCPALGIYHDPPDSPSHGRLRRTLMRWDTRRFDARIFVSHATQARWTRWTGRGVNRVIHNGLPDRPRRPLPPPDHRVRVGFLGMYTRHKGFPMLADWIARTADLPVRWQLYGDLAPDLAEDARAIAARYSQSVHLCGRKPPEDIYREIDVLVQPSTSFDPFPTVLLEAARAGIPVVSSHLGGSPEIVIDGETGFLFDPETPEAGLAAVRELVAGEALRGRLGRTARDTFERQLGIGPMVKAYLDLWAEICPPAIDRPPPDC